MARILIWRRISLTSRKHLQYVYAHVHVRTMYLKYAPYDWLTYWGMAILVCRKKIAAAARRARAGNGNKCALRPTALNQGYVSHRLIKGLLFVTTQMLRGQFHIIDFLSRKNHCFTEKKCLSRFLWLPAKLSYKMYEYWLVVCFKLLSKNICLAQFSAQQLYEIDPRYGVDVFRCMQISTVFSWFKHTQCKIIECLQDTSQF